jgi:hypothetical protein
MTTPENWCYQLAVRLSDALETGTVDEIVRLRQQLGSLSAAELERMRSAPRLGAISPADELDAFLELAGELTGSQPLAFIPPARMGALLQVRADTPDTDGGLRWAETTPPVARFALHPDVGRERLRVYLQSSTAAVLSETYHLSIKGALVVDGLHFTPAGTEDAFLDLDLAALDPGELQGWQLVSVSTLLDLGSAGGSR